MEEHIVTAVGVIMPTDVTTPKDTSLWALPEFLHR